MKTEQLQDHTLTYDDSPKARRALFNACLEWFKEQQTYCGDSVFQSDACQIDGPQFLASLADDIFKFEANYE